MDAVEFIDEPAMQAIGDTQALVYIGVLDVDMLGKRPEGLAQTNVEGFAVAAAALLTEFGIGVAMAAITDFSGPVVTFAAPCVADLPAPNGTAIYDRLEALLPEFGLARVTGFGVFDRSSGRNLRFGRDAEIPYLWALLRCAPLPE